MPPDVVWITLDSVRADHTSLHGYHRDTTPCLESLADDGLHFPNCYASGNGTLVSTGSILTGVQPIRHGLGGENEIFPDEIPDPERTVTTDERDTELSDEMRRQLESLGYME